MLEQLFKAMDAKDAVAFAGFLSPGCTFRFGNLSAVSGADAVREFVAGFFAYITRSRMRYRRSGRSRTGWCATVRFRIRVWTVRS